MSKYLKPSLYNGRGKENIWINFIYQSHDIICGCNHPIDHLNYLIEQQKCPRTTEKDSTKETTGTTGKEETPFDEGDLEQLFAETFENEG